MENKREKIVSIIIPVYQAKDTLKTCVLSCLNQKYVEPSELEVILIDDGSTDGSADICDELQREYGEETVCSLHIRNDGVSHARNVGLDRAGGRFVVFVDSDDQVSETFLENMMKRADETTALVDETDVYSYGGKISGFQYIENVILGGNTHVWGKLVPGKVLSESGVRFDESLTIGEDLIFMIDYALHLEKRHCITCIPAGDYIYNDNADGAMNSTFNESDMDQFAGWRLAEEKLSGYGRVISQYAFVSLSVSQIMTALLVVGKVAVLDEKDRDKAICDKAI
jgi:glycosyltransferase involved in cell wall biosynthesis